MSSESRKIRKIDSKDNENIKNICVLQQSGQKRRKAGLFVVEGLRLCKDAIRSDIDVVSAFFTEKFTEDNPAFIDSLNGDTELYLVSEKVLEKMSDITQPQGILMLCRIPQNSLGKILKTGHYIALESIRDPGNLGTILRSAEAMGVTGVLLSSDCADIYSPKTLRSTMGAAFREKIGVYENLPLKIKELRKQGIKCYASVVSGDAHKITELDMSSGGLIVIGNEAHGVSNEIIDACGCNITIPMRGRAESLNAATAATLLIWELCGKIS